METQELLEQTKELAVLIKQSKLYQEYLGALEVVKKDEELYRRINEYRRIRMMLQMNDVNQTLQESGRIRWEYDSVLRNEQALAFFTVERRLIKLLRDINHCVMDGIELDVDFLQ
ncbi:MAG: YlbF family regulator [Clostridiales bacterium]|nr:YlbF family regulator [Clostridiales bacterium]